MSKVVFFKTLDEFGEASVDLHSCRRRWQIIGLDMDHPDFPHEGSKEVWFYLTPENRWVEHERGWCPYASEEYERFSEVTPAYAIQQIRYYYPRKLPPDLAAVLGPLQDTVEQGPPAPCGPAAQINPDRPTGASGPAEGRAEPRGGKRPRNQGKAERCRGIYLAYLTRRETPPSIAEIARQVGCDRGTASRALRELEDTRAELAREDAQHRYRDHA